MDVSKAIKMMMLDRGMKQSEVAEQIYGTKSSKNTFNNTLRRNDFKLQEIARIADILGFDMDLRFVNQDTGKVIEVEQSQDKTE